MDKSKKKQTAPKNKKHGSLITIGVLVFVALSAFVLLNMDSIYSSEKQAGGYPVSFSGNDVVEAKALGNGIAVLTGKSLHYLDKRGAEKFNLSYTFAEPAVNTKGKYGVIFDRRSYNYIFFDNKGGLRHGKTDNSAYIYLAQVSEKGDLVIVTKSSSAACHLYMYNKNGDEIFAWSCGDEYIVSVDINSSSKEILCGALGAFGGEISTKAYLIDPKSETPVKREYTVSSAACVDVRLSGNSAVITCSDRIAVYDTKKKDDNGTVTEFSSPSLRFAGDKDGNTAIITDALTKENGEFCLSLYNNEGTLVSETFFSSEPKALVCYNSRAYLLNDFSVRQFTLEGEEKEELSLNKKGLGITVSAGNVYSYSLGSVEKAIAP